MARTVLILVLLLSAARACGASTSEPSTSPTSQPTTLPSLSRSMLSLRCDTAIQHGVQFLLSRQRPDGSWHDSEGTDTDGGQTALVTLALLSAGVDHQTPQLAAAIKLLKKAKATQVYSVGLRACVYAQLPESMRQTELRIDLAWLQKAMIGKEPNDGLYSYALPDAALNSDYSNSQYGLLGVWYAAEAGLEVPLSYWRRAEQGWRRGQQKDGGWGYTPDGFGGSYASMTAAGAATLFITNDYLHGHEAYDLYHLPVNRPLESAVDWLGKNFSADRNPGRGSPLPSEGSLLDAVAPPPRMVETPSWIHYLLFGYERVGEASGLVRFGSHEWFAEGARHLCNTQWTDGSWPCAGDNSNSPEVETAYALLFLSRGQSPVVIQKLKWGNRWDNRTRDLADYVRFLRHESERHVNWQIVDASAGTSELRAAPLLWAASDRTMEFKDAEAANVKTYIEQGGTLVCANEGKTQDFSHSVEGLFQQLFPPYKFKDLPADDAMLTGNFSSKGWTDPVRVLGNGVRKLVVLYPSGDVPWKFQVVAGAPTNRLSPYTPTANLWVNSLGGSEPLLKGQSTWIDRDESIPAGAKAMRLARLQYAGNWNPEPAGWQRLANILHNAADGELAVDVIPLANLNAAARPVPLVHLTGTATIVLTGPEESALKAYLDHGGLLLFDAAGGSPEAATSIQAILAKLYPGSRDEPLPVDHPIYRQQPAIDAVSYRRSMHLVPSKLPRLRGISVGGKLVAIVSAEDLSAGLTGYTGAGFAGYSPTSSAEILRAVLQWTSTADR